MNALNRRRLVSWNFGNFKLVGKNDQGEFSTIKVYPSVKETLVFNERVEYKSLVY